MMDWALALASLAVLGTTGHIIYAARTKGMALDMSSEAVMANEQQCAQQKQRSTIKVQESDSKCVEHQQEIKELKREIADLQKQIQTLSEKMKKRNPTRHKIG